MLLADPVFLTIVVFGVLTSYTDIKYGKIKNISVILLLVCGTVINLFVTRTFVDLPFKSLLNPLIALAVGFLMWCMGLWSSGDAKLFFGFSLLLPITIYQNTSIPYFLSFEILFNIFVPVGLFLLVSALLKIKFSDLKMEIKKMFKLSETLNLILFLVGFSYGIGIVFGFLNLQLGLLLQTLILFAVIEVFRKKLSYFNIMSILLVILRIVFSLDSLLSLLFLKQIISILLLFQGLRLILKYIFEFSFSERIRVKDLKPGMMLSEQIIKDKDAYKAKEVLFINLFGMMRSAKDSLSTKFSGILSEDDVQELKRLQKQKKLGFETLKIAKTVPFAPFMFFGVLVTYLVQGNALSYLMAKSYLLIYAQIYLYKIFKIRFA